MDLYLLDNNAISNYFRGTYTSLADKINKTDRSRIWISGIAVAEIMRGRLADIKAVQDTGDIGSIGSRYEYLIRSIENLSRFQMLPYDAEAEQLYIDLRKTYKKVKPNDLRIAASALSARMTVITADKSDFGQIRELQWLDWSAE